MDIQDKFTEELKELLSRYAKAKDRVLVDEILVDYYEGDKAKVTIKWEETYG